MVHLPLMEPTRASLLWRLRQADAGAAWEQFCLQYGGAILRYAQKLGLNEADAQDVLQESLVALVRQMPRFEYDPARGLFRNFLLTIVHRQAAALFRRRGRKAEVSFIPAMDAEPLASSADVDARWQEALFDEAWARLRTSGALQARTLAVFEAYAMRGESAGDVGKKHAISANTVYQIRNRIVAMLKQEVDSLACELDSNEAIL